MKFGLFDHIEFANRPLATTFDERLRFIQLADEAGFYCVHLAEHHCSPLNMVPVPGVFMGAIARLTKQIRFGPMVYLLPLYSPLRLAEEICMLDHLSHGRMEIGVGRGVSPFELGFHKIDHDKSRDIFIDAYPVAMDQLEDRLRALKSVNPSQAVVIKGDARAQYLKVMQVLETLKRVDITDIGLVTGRVAKGSGAE